ncbi:esterase, partial [Micromonospora chalcea]
MAPTLTRRTLLGAAAGVAGAAVVGGLAARQLA